MLLSKIEGDNLNAMDYEYDCNKKPKVHDEGENLKEHVLGVAEVGIQPCRSL